MKEKYTRIPNTQCSVCSTPLYRRPCLLSMANGKAYCSAICYGKSCRKESPCIVCGSPILAHFNKKTCSRSCANSNRSGIKYKISSPHDKVKAQQALKLRLLKLRDNKCERCNFDKYYILQMHHKNRNRNDNSIENLELICPNCHYEEHHFRRGRVEKIL